MGVQYCSRNCQKQDWTAGRHSSKCAAVTPKPKIVDQEPEIPDTFIGPICAEKVMCTGEKKQKLMCANCSDFNVSLMRCQCQLVLYCTRECQKQHWHGIHKTQCTVRKPEIPTTFKQPIGKEKVKCRICHTAIEKEACVLPCGHKFHISCVDGVSLNCPICRRVSAWEDAKKAHENCYRRYITMKLENSTGKTTNDTSLLHDWIMIAEQGYPDAMFMVGRLYMDSNVFEAERWFCKLGNHTNALTNLGFIKSHQGDVKGAIEYYKKAIKVDPKNVSPHFGLGYCMLKVEKLTEEEKLTEAIKCFREVIRLDPDHADGHYNLGWALWNSSFYMGAVAAYKRTLRFDPGHKKASNNLKQIGAADLGTFLIRRYIKFIKVSFLRWRKP
jgi:predicted TPR repeat methyltransferase